MKKIGYLLVSMLLFSAGMYAQGEVEALKFSRHDLYGTARSMAMGGAFGALGGDITGVSINPAGIAVYRSSEVVGTFAFANQKATVGNLNKSVTDYGMDNLGFIGYFPLSGRLMPFVNFGFSYNKQKSFSSHINAAGAPANPLVDYIADKSYDVDPAKLKMGDNLPDPFLTEPWLSVLGFNSFLINPVEGSSPQRYTPLNTRRSSVTNNLRYFESGSIENYDFTVGTTFNHVLSTGITLSVASATSRISNYYTDKFEQGDYTMSNNLITTGAGVSGKFGVIYRPVNAFRIGLSYQTPAYYTFTEIYDAEMADNVKAYVSDPKYQPNTTYSARFTNYYNLATPDKWTLSSAVVLGKKLIVSADYELIDYRRMKLQTPNGDTNPGTYNEDNHYIKKDYKLTSTFRVGTEYRFTLALYGRLGYAWMQNPYSTEFKEAGDAFVSGSNTVFVMEGDANYFTGGLGYRFNKNFYADVALVYKTQNSELYPFPKLYTYNGDKRDALIINSSPFKLKNDSFRGMLTLGFRY